MNARDMAVQLSGGSPVKRSGSGWMVQCPAHEDSSPSLSVSPGTTTDVVIHCHAGCTTEDVLAAANLGWADVTEHEEPVSPNEITYDYLDDTGHMRYQVVRKPGKKFLQRRPGPGGEWVWNLRGIERVLYRLPDVMEAVKKGEPVWITEGEKDADHVWSKGVCATTHPGGAGKWQDSYSQALEGADVTVWADRDEPGWKHAHAVRESLLAHNVG